LAKVQGSCIIPRILVLEIITAEGMTSPLD